MSSLKIFITSRFSQIYVRVACMGMLVRCVCWRARLHTHMGEEDLHLHLSSLCFLLRQEYRCAALVSLDLLRRTNTRRRDPPERQGSKPSLPPCLLFTFHLRVVHVYMYRGQRTLVELGLNSGLWVGQ